MWAWCCLSDSNLIINQLYFRDNKADLWFLTGSERHNKMLIIDVQQASELGDLKLQTGCQCLHLTAWYEPLVASSHPVVIIGKPGHPQAAGSQAPRLPASGLLSGLSGPHRNYHYFISLSHFSHFSQILTPCPAYLQPPITTTVTASESGKKEECWCESNLIQ